MAGSRAYACINAFAAGAQFSCRAARPRTWPGEAAAPAGATSGGGGGSAAAITPRVGSVASW